MGAKRAFNGLNIGVDKIILDGSHNYAEGIINCQTLVKADNIIPAVSAASIIAKVARDDYMIELAKQFPMYMFESHVGYGTLQHRKAIITHGATIQHRKSFEPIKSMSQAFE